MAGLRVQASASARVIHTPCIARVRVRVRVMHRVERDIFMHQIEPVLTTHHQHTNKTPSNQGPLQPYPTALLIVTLPMTSRDRWWRPIRVRVRIRVTVRVGVRVRPPGIFGGDPESPYAYGDVHVRIAFSPFFMVAKP